MATIHPAWLLAAALLVVAAPASAEPPALPPPARDAAPAQRILVCPHPYQGVEYRTNPHPTRGFDRVYRAGPNPCVYLPQRTHANDLPVFLRVDFPHVAPMQ